MLIYAFVTSFVKYTKSGIKTLKGKMNNKNKAF